MIEKVARAIAGHFGPEFDDLPKDKAERINRNRVGEMFDDSQEDVLEAAKAAVETALDMAADSVAERIASEFKGFWAAEDLLDEIPGMIRSTMEGE